MRKKIIALLLILTLAMLPQVSVLAAVTIDTVTPGSVVNNAAATITIQGADFQVGASVSLGTYGVLAATVNNATTITATLPYGVPAGTYDITVTNPDLTTATKTGALTVLAPTATPPPYARPQIVIDSYSLSISPISYGQDFTLSVSLDNAGSSTAYGIQVIFSSSDLLMLKNGGVAAAGDLGTAGKAGVSQTMTAAAALTGRTMVSVDMNVTYSDSAGTAYTEKFTLNLPVHSGASGGSSNYVAATATPTGVRRSQLVITGYTADIDPLQPGLQFTLQMSVKNLGNVTAKGVTMIVGGGSSSSSGTPQAGGISGASGEFTNFAPVGSSNIQSLGDLAASAGLEVSQKLVVNVSTNPGAYPMKISFSYLDSQGNVVNDDQVITLMVYRLPSVDIGFYQDAGFISAGQPALLPFQVVNLGKSSAVLGNMKVITTGGMLENATALVGPLDPGGYFTLDSMLIPDAPGPLDLFVTIDYTDDFSQLRTITKTITLEVMEAPLEPTLDPSMPGGDGSIVIPGTEETFWQKAWRFILGIFGLDSSKPVEQSVPGGISTAEPIQPFPGGGGGGGKG